MLSLVQDEHLIYIQKNKVTIVAAPRGSGKSYLTNRYLTHNAHLYDHIYIMCPSIEFNDDYLAFKKNTKFKFFSKPSNEKIEEVFEQQANCMRKTRKMNKTNKINNTSEHEYRCAQTLLVIDDCIDSGIMAFSGVVDKIAERGRHINLSLWINAQRISSISRSIRINADYFIIFSPSAINEFEQFIEQFVPKKFKKAFREGIDIIFGNEYQFLILDNTEKSINRKLKVSTANEFISGKSYLLNFNQE